MSGLKRFINIICIICGILLCTSYFLPVELFWSPSNAWDGYCIGGEFVKGLDISLIEIPPYATGLVIILSLILLKWPRIPQVLVTFFSAFWIVSLVLDNFGIFSIPSIEFPALWLILSIIIPVPLVFLMIFVLTKFNKQSSVLMLLVILSAASLLQQTCSIAFYLLEDKLLLNVGSVTGVASATALFISLMVKTMIQKESDRKFTS